MSRNARLALLTGLALLAVVGVDATASAQTAGRQVLLPRTPPPPPPSTVILARLDLPDGGSDTPQPLNALNVSTPAVWVFFQAQNVNIMGQVEVLPAPGSMGRITVTPRDPRAFPSGTFTLDVVTLPLNGSGGAIVLTQENVPQNVASCPVIPAAAASLQVCSLSVPIPPTGGPLVVDVTTSAAGLYLKSALVR